LIAPDKDLTGFGGRVLYYIRVLDLLDIGAQTVKIRRGFIDLFRTLSVVQAGLSCAEPRNCRTHASAQNAAIATKETTLFKLTLSRRKDGPAVFQVNVIVAHSNGCAG